MMLTWENGRCTNEPEGWRVRVYPHATNPHRWTWDAELRGEAWHSGTTAEGAPVEVAQADCEATLLVLGVLALPEWSRGEDGRWFVLRAGPFEAIVRDGHGIDWCISHANPVLGVKSLAWGGATGVSSAKSTAETVLRALLAAHLRGAPC